jgi:hypothetical protein
MAALSGFFKSPPGTSIYSVYAYFESYKIIGVTFVHRFSGNTSSCGCIPEMLVPKNVTSIKSKGWFVTTGESMPPTMLHAE